MRPTNAESEKKKQVMQKTENQKFAVTAFQKFTAVLFFQPKLPWKKRD